jgi:hypothetical protein
MAKVSLSAAPGRQPSCSGYSLGAMEAPAMWTIYPEADREEVEDLVTRLAAELGIDKPPLQETTVALPPDGAGVAAALDRIEPRWRERALLLPPGPH